MTRAILLHVGCPKTGTSYLQDVLFQNRVQLAEQGLLYPAERFDGQFLAALDLLQLKWGGLEAEAVGAWDELARKAREWPGTVVISHEILAVATREQAMRALESLGWPDREIRIVVSARDLVRQIPAEWQENVKHRRTFRYQRFLQQIQAPEPTGRVATWFWNVQDLPSIIDRWAGDLDPAAVTVVTVPPPGAPKDLLWERFAGAFGLDGLRYERSTERANPSLGVPESHLLRRINLRAVKLVEPMHYRPLVRELLAHQTLAKRSGSARLSVPDEVWTWADGVAQQWVADLRERGVRVSGDLADLLPQPRQGEYADPDVADQTEVAAAAIDVITALILEGVRLREVEAQLRRELEQATDDRGLGLRARERVYRSATQRPLGRKALGLYHRSRRRNS